MAERFQTLIGTVKSSSSRPSWPGGSGFQTLIGTVKSREELFSLVAGSLFLGEFQTLIGTVKSKYGRRWARITEARFQTLIGTVKRVGLGDLRSRPKMSFKPS